MIFPVLLMSRCYTTHALCVVQYLQVLASKAIGQVVLLFNFFRFWRRQRFKLLRPAWLCTFPGLFPR